MKKIDLLAFAAHPDDAELSCGGTLALHQAQGWKTGIIDLTRGEMGTRGSVSLRAEESSQASQILKLEVRGNLGLRDGFVGKDEQDILKVIYALRKYQPEVVLANAPKDRHPDHGHAASLLEEACFLSGLAKIKTIDQGVEQDPWRPKRLFHYIQDVLLVPDFVIDISTVWETKLASIKAYTSQFYDPNSHEPNTYIASPLYFDYIKARSVEMGHSIGVAYGEGFISSKKLHIRSFQDLI